MRPRNQCRLDLCLEFLAYGTVLVIFGSTFNLGGDENGDVQINLLCLNFNRWTIEFGEIISDVSLSATGDTNLDFDGGILGYGRDKWKEHVLILTFIQGVDDNEDLTERF